MRGIVWVNLLVSGITIAIGLFFIAKPQRAPRLWGQSLDSATVNGGVRRRLYRIAGVLLCVAGLLVAVENIIYHEPTPPVIKIPPPAPIT